MAQTTVGIVGTGRMGTAIGKRLMESGHAVVAWNRTAERTGDLAAAGATIAANPAALRDRADVVITSLTDQAALAAVFGGDSGLLADGAEGTLFIEMSTLLPDEQQALAADAHGAGAGYVECPVGGTVGPALKGQLLGMAGGSTAEFERARPILETLCKRVDHLGEVGAGAKMKLAVNLPLALYWATLGEAIALLPEGSGLDGHKIADILAASSGGPNVLKNRMEVVAKTIDGTDQPGTFDINGLAKDLRLALLWARRSGKAMPLTQAAEAVYAEAIAAGLGGFDGATIARRVRAGGAA
ncbi:MAG: NAD(P)-dependent oxidoreductase [Acuticoccus sp.]